MNELKGLASWLWFLVIIGLSCSSWGLMINGFNPWRLQVTRLNVAMKQLFRKFYTVLKWCQWPVYLWKMTVTWSNWMTSYGIFSFFSFSHFLIRVSKTTHHSDERRSRISWCDLLNKVNLILIFIVYKNYLKVLKTFGCMSFTSICSAKF